MASAAVFEDIGSVICPKIASLAVYADIGSVIPPKSAEMAAFLPNNGIDVR
jgi:hypothetical protein